MSNFDPKLPAQPKSPIEEYADEAFFNYEEEDVADIIEDAKRYNSDPEELKF
jgi:hypothetical protein